MPSRKMGLCLAGGGITGAMYEVGVLAALEDTFLDFSAADFDVFVGSGSGSVVATALAGGLPALRIYRSLLDPADDFFPFQRQHLMRFDRREIKRVWGSAFGSLRRLLGSVTSRPLKTDLWTEFDRFYDSVPAGIFTVEAFEQFFDDFLTRRNIARSFVDFDKPLRLIANDLDQGERVAFGMDGLETVPVAKAVAASMAAPMLFAPVRIDGRDFIAGGGGEAGHVDIAVELGCETVFVINAMVPIRTDRNSVPTGHGKKSRIRDKGLLWVYNQSWRLVAEARLQAGLAKYKAEHPNVAIHLIEPSKDDATMFMYSPMNFAARRVILEDGYTTTKQILSDEASPLRKTLKAAGWVPKD